MLALPLHYCEAPKDPRAFGGLRGDVLSQMEGVQASDVHTLLNLRKESIQVASSSELNLTHLTNYAVQLLRVAPKLADLESELRLELHWSSAFSTTKFITSLSIYFELACVLWNIAANYSILAVRSDRKSTEGLKNACRNFQLAAVRTCRYSIAFLLIRKYST